MGCGCSNGRPLAEAEHDDFQKSATPVDSFLSDTRAAAVVPDAQIPHALCTTSTVPHLALNPATQASQHPTSDEQMQPLARAVSTPQLAAMDERHTHATAELQVLAADEAGGGIAGGGGSGGPRLSPVQLHSAEPQPALVPPSELAEQLSMPPDLTAPEAALVPADPAGPAVNPLRVLDTRKLTHCAVSLRFLKDFAAAFVPDGMPSLDVIKIVLAKTAGKEGRYVEDPDLIAPEHVGKPTYFISHTWTGDFTKLVAAVSRHLADEIDTQVFVWVDMFAVNQRHYVADLKLLKDVIQIASGGTLVVLGDEFVALRRIWCLYEFANTVTLKGPDSLQWLRDPGTKERLSEMVPGIHVEAAEATDMADHTRILNGIRADFGEDPAPFNALLKLLLLLKPLDYSVDLRSLLEQCLPSGGKAALDEASPIWDLSPVHSWLQRAAEAAAAVSTAADGSGSQLGGAARGKARALVVCGGPGEGKSTLAALLVASAGNLARYQKAATAPAEPHSRSMAGGPTPPARFAVHAWHFFKHNDSRRHDAARIIQTLAYQLGTCPDLPSLRDVYMDYVHDDTKMLHSELDTEALFEALLKAPLEKYAKRARNRAPIVILFDGLDEADNTGATSSFAYNPMLRLLCEGCAQLPGVCFVITSRGDAVDRSALARLHTAFHVTEIEAASLHRATQLRKQIAMQLLAPLPEPALEKSTKTPWRASSAADADQVAGMLLIHSQAQAFILPHASPEEAAEQQPGPSIAAGLPSHSKSTASLLPVSAKDTAHSMVYLTVCVELLQRGWVTPTSLPSTLHAAYSVAFEDVRAKRAGPGAAESDQQGPSMSDLLAVLVAAREPLSPSQLRSLKLDHLRPLLPLMHALFYERDMRMYLLHKSLSEFLLGTDSTSRGRNSDSSANSAALVNVSGGHLYLALASHSHQTQHAASADAPPLIVSPHLGRPYALRHVVAHACQAGSSALLNTVLVDLSLWEDAYSAGFGPSVLLDLQALAKQAPADSCSLVADLLRWLRASSEYLVQHPRAALQLACDSPHNSLLAVHAATVTPRPFARLLNKEQDWPVCLLTSKLHEDQITGVTLSSDGRTVVSFAEDKTIQIWDLASGKSKGVIELPGLVASVALSADGTTIVTGAHNHTVGVWDRASLKIVQTLKGHTKAVNCVVISQDGKFIVSGSADHSVKLWDLARGICVATLDQHTGAVSSVAIGANNKVIVSGSADKTVRVWDITAGACRSIILKGHTKKVACVAISADCRMVVSGSTDETVRVWELAGGRHVASEKLNSLDHIGSVGCVAISLDGRTIVSGSDDAKVWWWDVESRGLQGVHEHDGPVTGVAITPDGTAIISSSDDETVRVWELRHQSSDTKVEGHTDEVGCVALTPDGLRLVSGSDDTTLKVWELESGTAVHTLQGHSGDILSLAITPDGVMLVSTSSDSTARVWDLAAGKSTHTLKGHAGRVTCVAISPDSRTAATGSDDMKIRLWDLATGKLNGMPLCKHEGIVNCIAISPDGGTLASGADDSTVRVWDMVTGQLQHTLQHTGGVTRVEFNVDSLRVTASADDGTTDEAERVWDLPSGSILSTFTGVAAKVQRDALQGWKRASSGVGGPQRTISVGRFGDVVDITQAARSSQVFILPPCSAFGDMVRISADGKRLGVCDAASGRFLCYSLE